MYRRTGAQSPGEPVWEETGSREGNHDIASPSSACRAPCRACDACLHCHRGRCPRRRPPPAPAVAGGPSLRDVSPESRPGMGLGSVGGLGGGHAASPAVSQVAIQPADFDAFERLLGETQTAYGKEDLAALKPRVTPEMLSYFAEDLAANASRGVVNQISDVKLVQGDLAEAWREGNVEYATVAMRFALIDKTVDRASGRVVEGSAEPQ